MAKLILELTHPQARIIDCPARFRQVIAGRRFGKTVLAKAEIITEGRKPNRNIVYVAPTYSMAKRLMWKPLMRMIPRSWIIEKSVSDLSFTLKTGSVVTLFGSKNYDSIRGDGNDLIIFDEGADIPREAWDEAARPSLSDRKGRALFIGTPKGRGNWQYDIHTDPAWEHFEYTTLEGGWVEPEEIEAAREELDERTFRQEYEASFESYGGLVYYNFSDATTGGNVASVPFNPTAETWLCWDFNAGERPMSVIVVQRTNEGYAAVKEFVYKNTSTEDMCEAIRKWLTEMHFRGPIRITGDYAGNRRESSASRSDYLIIESHFKNYLGYETKARPTTSIQDRVNALCALFCTSTRQRRLLVDPSCKQLIRGLLRVTWKDSGSGLQETSIGEIDPTDALSYFAFNYHPVHRRQMTVTTR